jgi:hypothetical protein
MNKPHIYFALLLCALGLTTLATPSYAGRCEVTPARLDYKAVLSNTKFNVSTSAEELHRLHGGGGGGKITGLALSPLRYNFKARYNVTPHQNGGYCIALNAIDLAFLAQPVVFISNEFPRGSCEFNAILRHENKHVRVLKTVHAAQSEDFKRQVENAIARLRPEGPLPKDKVKAAQMKMQQTLERLLDQNIKNINALLATEQNKIDSPGEYARLQNECAERP